MADAKRVLVTGATGQQGGAVVDALLKDGNTVRALTRNPQSDKAAALKSRGVEIVSGDFGDRSSLEAAIRGVDAAFLLSTSFEAGTEAETAQGIAFVEAAAAVNLPYLVYTSVGDANRATGIPHFDSKYRVEERIKELGIDHAIIAPAYFYENMMAPFVLPGLRNGVFAQALPGDIVLKMVSVKDIGEFGALAIANPDRFKGTRTDIAGDGLTGEQCAAVIAAASGHKVGYAEVPLAQLREMGEDMALMFEWFATTGYSADIEGLRREYPEVGWERFEEWANRQDWSVLNATA